MQLCPNCQKENQPGTVRCEDCGAILGESSTDSETGNQAAEAGQELVELAEFQNFPEAEMIQELLEGNGIITVLRGEADPIGVASGAAPSTLLVSLADLPQARRIYEDFFAANDVEGNLQPLETDPDDEEEEADPEQR